MTRLTSVAIGCLLLAVCNVVPASADDVTYTYDTLGRLTSVTYACGKSITYTYDAAGNRTAVVTTGCT